jgi:hypothetical protein
MFGFGIISWYMLGGFDISAYVFHLCRDRCTNVRSLTELSFSETLLVDLHVYIASEPSKL